jgi:hypothetical protein
MRKDPAKHPVQIQHYGNNVLAASRKRTLDRSSPDTVRGYWVREAVLHDLYIRIGGSYAGTATTSLENNQNDVLVDHAWLWRADHGNTGTTGWDINRADHGLIVEGSNVTALGLFAERYQQSQIVWKATGGPTIFMECEPPYDPPTQAAWTNGSENGYPCYEVAGNVASHEAVGLISWTFFRAPPPNVIYARSAVKTPSHRTCVSQTPAPEKSSARADSSTCSTMSADRSTPPVRPRWWSACRL